MADKTSTVVLDVDLECAKCNKKIRKALCKFYEIQSISFDEKEKKVIVSGPFNPHCLINRLYCNVGCKVIKGHHIVQFTQILGIEIEPPKEPKPEDAATKPPHKPRPSKRTDSSE